MTNRAIILNINADLARVRAALPEGFTAHAIVQQQSIVIEGEGADGILSSIPTSVLLHAGPQARLVAYPLADNCEGHLSPFAYDDDDATFCTGTHCLYKDRPVLEWRSHTAKYFRARWATQFAERLTESPQHYRNVVRKGTVVTFEAAIHAGGDARLYHQSDLAELVSSFGSVEQPGHLDGQRVRPTY